MVREQRISKKQDRSVGFSRGRGASQAVEAEESVVGLSVCCRAWGLSSYLSFPVKGPRESSLREGSERCGLSYVFAAVRLERHLIRGGAPFHLSSSPPPFCPTPLCDLLLPFGLCGYEFVDVPSILADLDPISRN